MLPLLFSSRTTFVIFPAPSAVKRPAVAIAPLALEPPIRMQSRLERHNVVVDFLLREDVALIDGRDSRADEFHTACIHDVESIIEASNVRGAAAVRGAVAVGIHLIERARRKYLLIGGGTIDIGVKQPMADATVAVRTEPPNNEVGTEGSEGSGNSLHRRSQRRTPRRAQDWKRRGVLPL